MGKWGKGEDGEGQCMTEMVIILWEAVEEVKNSKDIWV